MDVLSGKTDISRCCRSGVLSGNTHSLGGGFNVSVCNLEIPTSAMACQLATLLCRIVFIGQTAFGSSLDFQRVGLCPVGGGDKIIMRRFGALHARGALGHVIGQS